MQKQTYAKDLGKTVAKTEKYRLVQEGNYYRLYLISREVIWNDDLTFKTTNRKVAVSVGYVNNPANFETAIEVAEEELRSLMAEDVVTP